MRPRRTERGNRDFKRKRSKRTQRNRVKRAKSCPWCRHFRGSRKCAMARPQTPPRRCLSEWGRGVPYGTWVERWFRDSKWCPDFNSIYK